MFAKSARTDPGRHDRSVPCGFALNVGRVQLGQLGNWVTARCALRQAVLMLSVHSAGERGLCERGGDRSRGRPAHSRLWADLSLDRTAMWPISPQRSACRRGLFGARVGPR